jgi:hypothetical protein
VVLRLGAEALRAALAEAVCAETSQALAPFIVAIFIYNISLHRSKMNLDNYDEYVIVALQKARGKRAPPPAPE